MYNCAQRRFTSTACPRTHTLGFFLSIETIPKHVRPIFAFKFHFGANFSTRLENKINGAGKNEILILVRPFQKGFENFLHRQIRFRNKK